MKKIYISAFNLLFLFSNASGVVNINLSNSDVLVLCNQKVKLICLKIAKYAMRIINNIVVL